MFVQRGRAKVLHATRHIDIRARFLVEFGFRGRTVLHTVHVAHVLCVHNDDFCPVRDLHEDGEAKVRVGQQDIQKQ